MMVQAPLFPLSLWVDKVIILIIVEKPIRSLLNNIASQRPWIFVDDIDDAGWFMIMMVNLVQHRHVQIYVGVFS